LPHIPLDAEQQSVDGLEDQRRVVDVLHLHQRVAAGCCRPTLAFWFSQMALAVASEWLPSPTANSIGGVGSGRP
jgi:hypothetical protein